MAIETRIKNLENIIKDYERRLISYQSMRMHGAHTRHLLKVAYARLEQMESRRI